MNKSKQLLAAVRLLFPDEITPTAKAILEDIANRWEASEKDAL